MINRERQLQLIIFIGIILLIVLLFFVGLIFGEFYMFLFFIIIFLGSFLVITELYLRIQKNIDVGNRNYKDIKKHIKKGFDEQKKVFENIIDLFENLLKLVEDENNNQEDNFRNVKNDLGNVKNNLENIPNKINELEEKFSNKMVLLNESNDKKLNTLNKIKNLQDKMIVLNQQTLEYQKDQTNFLKNKIDQIKNVKRK